MITESYTADDPRNPSGSYQTVSQFYRSIDAVLNGAASVRALKDTCLPKYGAESWDEYGRRVSTAPWRPEFEDCLRNIAAKPFTKPVSLQGTIPAKIKAFAEDVDTLGNDLHNFARSTFWNGVGFGLHGVLVEYPTMQPNITLADERSAGARPYWCHIPAKSLIDVRTKMEGGKTVVSYVRFRLTDDRSNGRFGSKTVEQVKILEPGRWELWEVVGDKNEMVQVGEGTIALPLIPLALFYTGRRDHGSHPKPPLADLADMQFELYRALSREDEILTFAGSPMLTANGMGPPEGGKTIEVGPKRVLFAPNNGAGQTSWDFIQPAAANIEQIRKHIESIIDDMRRLGMQPLLPRSGDLTATVGALEAAKAHSAVEAWANGLKDALEQALVFTAEWLNEKPTAEVGVHTDFGVDIDGGADMAELLKARMAGEISRETYWDEMLRRGKLGPQFDPTVEEERLANEVIDQPVVAQTPPANDQAMAA
jgi:hypothetical protein